MTFWIVLVVVGAFARELARNWWVQTEWRREKRRRAR